MNAGEPQQPPPELPKPSTPENGRLGRARASFVRGIRDPAFPFLLIGVLAVVLVAALVLQISGELTFGLVFVGALTALLETIQGRDDKK